MKGIKKKKEGEKKGKENLLRGFSSRLMGILSLDWSILLPTYIDSLVGLVNLVQNEHLVYITSVVRLILEPTENLL